jgi:transcriptional regulator with XRE-family HTH domain
MTHIGEIRIGVRIKLARTKRHITQAQLANRTEMSQSYLSQIESGERTPRPEMVEMIGHALGCDLESEDW